MIHITTRPWADAWQICPFTGADIARWQAKQIVVQEDIDYGLLGPATDAELDNKRTVAWA